MKHGRLWKHRKEGGQRTVVVYEDDAIFQRGFTRPMKHVRAAMLELLQWGWTIVVHSPLAEEELRFHLRRHGIPFHRVLAASVSPSPSEISIGPHLCTWRVAGDTTDDLEWIEYKEISWVKVMRKLRRLYRPPWDKEIKTRAKWSNPLRRAWRWVFRKSD